MTHLYIYVLYGILLKYKQSRLADQFKTLTYKAYIGGIILDCLEYSCKY